MDEATDERLVFVNKNEQTSLDKEDIDRVDAQSIEQARRDQGNQGDYERQQCRSTLRDPRPDSRIGPDRPVRRAPVFRWAASPISKPCTGGR